MPNIQPVSTPVNPNEVSILTLPAEIRNVIYTSLFVVDEPIRLCIYSDAIDLENIGDSHGKVLTPASSCVSGVSLLRSCEQIYHEAFAIIYAQNKFICESDGTHYCSTLLAAAAQWLTSIGHRISCLGSLIINIDTSFLHHQINFLPLLKVLWKHPDKILAVSFPPASIQFPYDGQGLNDALKYLVADTELGIKKFARFPRLMNRVAVSTLGEYGEACLSSLLDGEVYHRGIHYRFKVSSYGLEKTEEEKRRPTRLVDLLVHEDLMHDNIVYEPLVAGYTEYTNQWIGKILANAIAPGGHVYTYDLTNKTMTPDLRGILQTSKVLRQRIVHEMRFGKTIRATATTRGAKGSFAKEISSLRSWTPRPAWSGVWPQAALRTIHFQFQVDRTTQMAGVRYDATLLVRATQDYRSRIIISVGIENIRQPECIKRRCEIPLREAQDNVLVALDFFAKEHPGYEGKCPTVWVDGESRWRETEITTEDGAVLRSVRADPTGDCRAAGYISNMAREIRNRINKNSTPGYVRSFGWIGWVY